MVATLPKTTELIHQLNAYIEKGIPVDAFTLRRWERDADQMLAKPELHVQGMIANGILASLNFDAAKIHKWFEAALNEQHSTNFLLNYFVSLEHAYLFNDVWQIINNMPCDASSSPEMKTWLLRECLMVGRFIEALSIIRTENLPEEIVARTIPWLSKGSSHLRFADSMEKKGFGDEVTVRLFEVAFQLMRERRLPFVQTQMIFLGENGFLVKHRAHISVDEAIELNLELSDRLADICGDLLLDEISLMFTPYESED